MKRFFACMMLLVLCICMVPTSAQVTEEFPIGKEAILSALYEADIAAMREAIDLKLITCEELTAYYLERIEAYNKPHNCFITMCDDALDIARQRDAAIAEGTASGSLFGIPIVIKDNIDLAGYHTTNGHKKTDDQIAEANAQIVDYLLAEGAVIIAKANMSTDAQSARDSISQVAGQTKNAYNKYLSSAGSSGGSAVATSLNFAAASLGTDTNSSLRMPAAYAGCISLRGTHGLISREGVTKLNGTRDIPGAITRTVYDQAIMLDVLTAGQYAYTQNLNGDALQGLRLGIMKELTYPVAGRTDRTAENMDPEVAAAFAAAVEELRACGVEIVEVSMPNVFTLYQATINSNAASKKETLYTAFTNLLTENNISAVIFPTYLSTPLHSGTDANGKYWNVWNQTWINNCAVFSPSASLPEITVPIGMHSLGCGIGLEIAAPKYQEQLLLDIAYSYTNRFDHRVLPESAPDTYSDANVGTLQEIIEAYKLFLNPPDPTTAPTEPTTMPTEPTTVPTEPPTVPTEPTTVPTEPTTVPTEPTTVPTEPTTVPTEPSTAPAKPTTVPEKPTTAPPTTPAATTPDTPDADQGVTWFVSAAVLLALLTTFLLLRPKKQKQ